MALAPPMNFSMVAPGEYRSGFPTRHNLGFLRALGLRTLVRLEDAPYPEDLKLYINSAAIKVVDCLLEANKEPFLTSELQEFVVALSSMLDSRLHPVLVHSLRGQRRAGVLVGCYRKLHGWSLAAIFE
ncbi:MAG: hypothetical protein SGPRY_008968, partial [Prymnesium sp.]